MSCGTHDIGGIQGGLQGQVSGSVTTKAAYKTAPSTYCGASAHSSSMVTLRIWGAPERSWAASSSPAAALRSLALMPSLSPMHTVWKQTKSA